MIQYVTHHRHCVVQQTFKCLNKHSCILVLENTKLIYKQKGVNQNHIVKVYTWEQGSSHPNSATLSQVTIIIHVAAKFSILGKRERILVVPCCSSEFCVVRYHNRPPFPVSMSVQKGAIILWDPLIGNGSEVYWVSGDPNVTSPLLFTYAIKKRFKISYFI